MKSTRTRPLDLPGVEPDRIELTIEKNVLTVSAERRWDRQDQPRPFGPPGPPLHPAPGRALCFHLTRQSTCGQALPFHACPRPSRYASAALRTAVLPVQSPLGGPGGVRPPPEQAAGRARPPRRGVQRPAVPRARARGAPG